MSISKIVIIDMVDILTKLNIEKNLYELSEVLFINNCKFKMFKLRNLKETE